MSRGEKIDEIVRVLRELSQCGPAKEMEKNLRALAEGFLARLNVVGREEFEAQERMLARALAQLEKAEKKLAAMESANQNSGGNTANPPPH